MPPLKRLLRRIGVRRDRAAPMRMRCERTLLAYTPIRPAPPRARILCYHSIGTPTWGVNDVSPRRFRRQLEQALSAGYRFVPAERIASGNGLPHELAITFDDGLASVARNAAPLLADYGIPWSLFVVSSWAEGAHPFDNGVVLGWAELDRLAARGARIGSHSSTHPNFAHIESGAAARELDESKQLICARLGFEPTAFAIPFGQSRDWNVALTAMARQSGYDVVFAQSEQRRSIGTIGRTFITRFDNDRIFNAALQGRFDRWEEWY